MANLPELLLQQYHHVALPRDVPGQEDHNLSAIDSVLLKRFIDAVKAITPFVPFEYQKSVDTVHLLLSTSRLLNVDGKVDKTLLVKELDGLNSNHALLLYVTEQNSALLVYRNSDEQLIFEAFETSASCEHVLAAEGALRWDFPGRAACIPFEVHSNKSFQESLAAFLEQASIESIKQFAAVTHKAAAPLPEIRDTSDPSLITGLLMTILECNGSEYSPKLLRKRVRDTVSFHKARKPWRRSPFYLAVRVAIQRHSYEVLGPERGRIFYKLTMCIFIMRLLDESLGALPSEGTFFLLQKLGRRVAKIVEEHTKASEYTKPFFDALFNQFGPQFNKSLSQTKGRLEGAWARFRANTRRVIFPLPLFADERSKRLSLPLSGNFLWQLFSQRFMENDSLPSHSPYGLVQEYDTSIVHIKPLVAITNRFINCFTFMEHVVNPIKFGNLKANANADLRCRELAQTMHSYVSRVGDNFRGHPGLMSLYLLDMLELWVELDKNAICCEPLLERYHPGFEPDILNPLQILSLNDMKRVRAVHEYIYRRCRAWDGARSKSIFDDPAEDSFAVEFFNRSPELQKLREEIQTNAEKERDKRELEWRELSAEHEHLSELIAGTACQYIKITLDDGSVIREHQRGCLKHKYKWEARQIKIQVFEWPLPGSEPEAKAAVFELMCPDHLKAYRDATFMFLSTFAYPEVKQVERASILMDHSGVKKYVSQRAMSVTLASATKSHMESHYAEIGFPVSWKQVCRPCGLKLKYFDISSRTWTVRQSIPSLHEHCPLDLPPGSPYLSLKLSLSHSMSSNQILANQTKCPSDLNVHEFLAWQNLFVGSHCRWLSLLRELGSTNLNFASESSWAAVNRLILQVGPSAAGDTLRDAHIVFNDTTFCTKLLVQVEHRLRAIYRNWREPIQMELLISILLKMASLSSSENIQSRVLTLLHEARMTTWRWCTTLQSNENYGSREAADSACWAAILCKRTFHGCRDLASILLTDQLRYFVYASVTLQENLVGKFELLPPSLRNAILRDLMFSHRNLRVIRKAILMNPKAFLVAISDLWPLNPEYLSSSPQLQTVSEERWIQLCVEADKQHFIHYHVLRGDFLVDGKQCGTLPAEYRLPLVERLFTTYNLRVYPSWVPGMSLVVKFALPHQHTVHIGFRKGNLVIRATKQGINSVFELIDPLCFQQGKICDLPAPLVESCFHWLDLGTGVLEIRQDDIWRSKESNWKIDLRTRLATRRGSTLIDPNSELAKLFTKNFYFFEHHRFITVYQPVNMHLSVEIKRLELSFYVNARGLLQSRQLGAFIVPTEQQDIGVWSGLKSKIVLRSVFNPQQLFVFLPLGPLNVRRTGEHVSVIFNNSGAYIKYSIDNVLGRIDCAAEPRLLYTKALCHALTSYFLPDQLTGRTGHEESLALLQSSLYKPWSPVSRDVMEILIDIARLTPRRLYYPENLKAMESIGFNPELTVTIQCDQYRGAVQAICERAAELSLFDTNPNKVAPVHCPRGNIHLERRAMYRSGLYRISDDQTYIARDTVVRSLEQSNTEAITRLLATWPSHIPNTRDLAELLQGYAVIGGFVDKFSGVQLFDRLTVNLGENLGPILTDAIQSTENDRYKLMFQFSPMAFSRTVNIELLLVLVSFAVLPELKKIKPPTWTSFLRFQTNELPVVKSIADIMKPARLPYSANTYLPGQLALERIRHDEASMKACVDLATCLCSQWPNPDICSDFASIDEELLDTSKAIELVTDEWLRLVQNFDFSKYIGHVQTVLNAYRSGEEIHIEETARSDFHEARAIYPITIQEEIPVTLQTLLKKSYVAAVHKREKQSIPVLNDAPRTNSDHEMIKQMDQFGHLEKSHTDGNYIQELRGIVTRLCYSSSTLQQEYGLELTQSIDALVKHSNHARIMPHPNTPILQQDIASAQSSCHAMLNNITKSLEHSDSRAIWLKYAGLWPKVTRFSLLTELRSTSPALFGVGMKEAILDLGLAITTLQRLLRIQDALRRNKHQILQDELANAGHTNWSPIESLDWLLLEIDGNLLLRPEQVEVARATIAPSSGSNAVLQLLMGAGKTSCILPMVAAVLANQKSLMRIVVPRALLLQSAQVLQTKLSALLDRELIHIPFSRKTPTEKSLMQTYSRLHIELRKKQGIILALPEHILSFQLSGVQALCDNRIEASTDMLKLQRWLNKYARDVLDECDASLAIRTQLIYPSGSQMAVDGHPLRWKVIQAVLRLIQMHLPELKYKFPQSIEVIHRLSGGEFPLIYFLRRDAEDYMIQRLVDDICKGQLVFLPCVEIPAASQQDIHTFISAPTMSRQVVKTVTEIFRDKEHLMKVVYLLRGLFVHRILLSTLKKRWNVQYGLHPNRDPIAVPYHAKGTPSSSSEWGHPDVALILTCLSFYYQGLDIIQFKQAFEQLLKADEPTIEYEKWATVDLPESWRDYTAINLEDQAHLRELHGHIRFNVHLLEFYMNNFVFPRHAKQFDMKLQASGWDLVIYPNTPQQCRTTGFSGTNDTRHQLPMTISQKDLPQLAHTNAEVLSYLLQDRNRQYARMCDGLGRRLTEDGLLQQLQCRGIRILIDAGAQVLEYTNHSLAKAWLKIDHQALGAVFFDEHNRAYVLFRKGATMPLVATPFAENLENCLVYLDESHCRGTDLKLPPDARAALTLGPHITKDALVQAAMRLRLLGRSQAVTFFSPPEVHQSILDSRDGSEKRDIDSADVIFWLLKQSCSSIEQLEPLYITQGTTYLKHLQASIDNQDYIRQPYQRSRYLSVMQTKESQTLKRLYEPKSLKKFEEIDTRRFKGQLKKFATDLDMRKKNFHDRGIAVHATSLEEVEQEREVEFEVESVRENQAPVHFSALRFTGLHADLLFFVKSGQLIAESSAYQPMIAALLKTALGSKHVLSFSVTPRLYVSTQCSRTVQVYEPNDNFIRPCHWILWNRKSEKAMIVSPEEANELLPLLRNHSQPRNSQGGATHLIVYSAPVTRRMLHFNNLDYHSTPPLPPTFKAPVWLKIELGIFSGRLYFSWDEYDKLCAYVGVKDSSDMQHEAFAKRPLTFLHEWLAVLRKGQDFEQTPMGYVTTGKALVADHPFFQQSNAEEPSKEPIADMTVPAALEEEESEESEDELEDRIDEEPAHDQGIMDDFITNENVVEDGENTFFDAEEYVEANGAMDGHEEK